MSASLYAEPINRKKDYLPISTPARFMDDIGKVFGNRLTNLTSEDIPQLRAIFELGGYDKEALEILERLIKDHGPIRLSAEY